MSKDDRQSLSIVINKETSPIMVATRHSRVPWLSFITLLQAMVVQGHSGVKWSDQGSLFFYY